MNSVTTPLSELLEELPHIPAQHARSAETYAALETAAREAVRASRFTQSEAARETLGGFGCVELPYHKMGAVDSLDLFGLDELIIFSFYRANRNRYRRAADIGANLGLHSILMGKCGWQVKAYEPDPVHATLLRRNLALNHSSTVELVEAAVSDRPGQLEFVRVLGNTTSSHLTGAKQNAYGQLERFPVQVESIASIMPTVDFVKMDAEGQEKVIILGTTGEHWRHTDMMLEVGSGENARAIFQHGQRIGVRAFAQKLGWSEVQSPADMPVSYKDGSLFLSRRPTMPWA
ncbi:MAG: FkbM family methyltransferase [Opitutaceae bacterium]